MNTFDKTYKIIMESIDTNYSDLFLAIKNNDDPELLTNWVEAIDELGIVDKNFTIDDMEHFGDTLDQEQLDQIIELGVEILHDSEDNNQNDVSECCDGTCKKDGKPCKCEDGKTVIEGTEVNDTEKIITAVKDFANKIKEGLGWIADDDDDIMTQFINACDPGVKEDESWFSDHREEILKEIEKEFKNQNIDFVPYSEIDDNGDRIINDDIESDLAKCKQLENDFNKELDSEILKEHHIPESNWFPVKTVDGVDTGWRMGPTDFGGRGRRVMKCSADPSHVITRDETIMIHPDFPGQQIAVETYYKAAAGDKALAEKLEKDFGLSLNLNL